MHSARGPGVEKRWPLSHNRRVSAEGTTFDARHAPAAGAHAPDRTSPAAILSGLLIAISALGIGTSLTAIAALGRRHVATVIGTTLVILVVVTAGLMLLA